MKSFLRSHFINAIAFVALVILTGSNVLAYLQLQKSSEAKEWVVHTYNVLVAATNLRLGLSDAESRFYRAYLLNIPLGPQEFAGLIQKTQNELLNLRSLTIDNPKQQNNLNDLEAIINQRVAFFQQFLAKAPSRPLLDISSVVTKEQLNLRQAFANKINEVNHEENALLYERNQQYNLDLHKSNIIFLTIASLSEALLLFCFILLNYQLRERDRAERTTRISEERMRLIIDAAKDYAIFMLDPEGIITTWSRAAENITGYTSSEMIGKHFSCFYSAADVNDHLPEKALLVANHDARYEVECLYTRKDGTLYLAHVVVSALRNPEGELIGYGEIIRDLTDIKKVEKAKNEFISVVSHELRTPITSIRGALGLVIGGQVGDLNDKAKSLLDIANQNCERLILLINDILDIEKIEAGKARFDLKIINLSDLVKEAVTANQSYADKYGISLKLGRMASEIKVHVDADRLMQVLSNLISNAVKFSVADRPVVISVLDKDNFVRVAVANQGAGISKEFQDKIFQKFTQADSSATRAKGGTGLGLNISKAIIENMKGTLNYTSFPDEETVFYFDLPKVNTQTKSPESEAQLVNTGKLLICEDDPDQSRYLQALLRASGFPSDIASSVTEAKKLLAKNSYQAILLDLILPDQDGVSFIRELRAAKETSLLPIIVLSIIAKTGKALLEGEAFSVIDWLEKPINYNQLLNAILHLKARIPPGKPAILHVEDDLDTQRIVQELLESHAQVTSVTTIDSAKKFMQESRFDLVILDLLLPDGNGAELLAELNKYKLPALIYSAIEVDSQYAKYVTQALIKSKTSNEELVKSIKDSISLHAIRT